MRIEFVPGVSMEVRAVDLSPMIYEDEVVIGRDILNRWNVGLLGPTQSGTIGWRP